MTTTREYISSIIEALTKLSDCEPDLVAKFVSLSQIDQDLWGALELIEEGIES